MTAIAVRGNWFLGLPVTVETRSVVAGRGFERRRPGSMTDGAVVVLLRRVRETQERDRVLVLVVRKLDRELKLRLRIAKVVTSIIARRSLRVTHRTDRRPRTAEELWPVTTHTSIVARVILDVRESDFVTAIASGAVFLGGVGKFPVISRG